MKKAPDANEFLRAHGADRLREAVAVNGHRFTGNGHARPDDQLTSQEIEAEIARLAALTLIEYERERGPAAKHLGFRPSVLDAIVKAARGARDDTSGQGRPLSLPEPVPSDDIVDGPELLHELCEAIGHYVVLPPNETVAVGLWVLHCYVFDIFTCTPRLAITSPEKQCGKTTLIDVLGCLVPRPLSVSSITAAAIYRSVELARPTLLIDEADTFIHDNDELRGILNSGHRRGGEVVRLVGDGHEPRQFSTHSPAAIAIIGQLPGTLADRSITIRMRRRLPDERVASFRSDRTDHLAEIAGKAARWAIDNKDALRDADPDVGGLFNRVADNWRPLLTIADAVGGDWPPRARIAAAALSAAADEGGTRTMLLADIRDYFTKQNADRATSEDLVRHLNGLEGRPWAEFKAGKELTKNGLARLLKPFNISPTTIRVSTGGISKGYLAKDFTEVFERYLGPGRGFQTATPLHPLVEAGHSGFQTATRDSAVAV